MILLIWFCAFWECWWLLSLTSSLKTESRETISLWRDQFPGLKEKGPKTHSRIEVSAIAEPVLGQKTRVHEANYSLGRLVMVTTLSISIVNYCITHHFDDGGNDRIQKEPLEISDPPLCLYSCKLGKGQHHTATVNLLLQARKSLFLNI